MVRKRALRRAVPKRRRARTRRTRIRGRRGSKIYYFTRFCTYTPLSISNIIVTTFGLNFSLSDLPNSAEFTSMFDMFKINCVKIWFIPQMTQSVSTGSINNPNAAARFFTAIDYNDSSAGAQPDDLREYSTCKFTPILRTHKRIIFKPKVLDSSGFTSSPWISTSVPATNYYGLKGAVEPMDSTSTTTMQYKIEAKFYLAFKNVK